MCKYAFKDITEQHRQPDSGNAKMSKAVEQENHWNAEGP